jgi:hypothetical protein
VSIAAVAGARARFTTPPSPPNVLRLTCAPPRSSLALMLARQVEALVGRRAYSNLNLSKKNTSSCSIAFTESSTPAFLNSCAMSPLRFTKSA